MSNTNDTNIVKFKTTEEINSEKELKRRQANRKANIKGWQDDKQESLSELIAKLQQGNIDDRIASVLESLCSVIISD